MLKTLGAQIKEYKAASIATPIFMTIEVLMETIIPFLMASIIDDGVDKGDMHHIYVVGGLMIVIAVHILMQPVQNLNAITISVQLMYVAAVILAVNFLYTKKLKRSLQKMNMKRFLHLTYLSKHLGMGSRKVIVDTERGSNLLILLNISMIN